LYKYLWVYIVAPFCGALIAGLANRGHLKSYNLVADVELKNVNLLRRTSKLMN